MRIAIIGPTHPYKGGIPLHTTHLAHRLEAAGHDVSLFSWKRQYPKLLYPGVQRVPGGKPETPPFGKSSEPLNWFDPLGWARLGRRLRNFDLVLITYFVPQFQGSSGLAMMQMLGRKHRPKVIAICHNVLQHYPRPGDRLITRLFLSRVDGVLVHSASEADKARQFTSKPIAIAPMAEHLPAVAKSAKKKNSDVKHHLLFFGLIRPYKGVDLLVQALAKVPNVSLTIAGEAREGMQAKLEQLVAKHKLGKRVTLRTDYVPADELPAVFAQADALVLPYRSGTGTQNVAWGFAHGLPVVATRTAGMDQEITDDVNGLLCKPGSVDDLVQALTKLYRPGVLARLQRGVPDLQAQTEQHWQDYISTLLSM